MTIKKEPIRLRVKNLKNGNKSLFLDCYLNGVRTYEFLKLYIIPERTRWDKEQNRTTLMQAEAHKAKRIIELQQGRFGVVQNSYANRIKLSEYVKKYSQRPNLSKNYSENITNVLKTIAAVSDVTIQQVNKNYIQAIIKHLSNKDSERDKCKKISPNTVRLHCKILSSVLNDAQRNGLISANPFNAMGKNDLPKPQNSTRCYLTLDEVRQLEQTPLKRGSVKRAFLLSCFCGLRLSDIMALRWCDIKPTSEGGQQVEITQQKTKETVVIPLSANAIKWIPSRPKWQTDTSLIFALPTKCRVNQLLKVWAANAGINKCLTFHVARHTCATLLLTYGADLYTVSKILGHTKITTTQIYAKVVDQKRVQAVNLIPLI